MGSLESHRDQRGSTGLTQGSLEAQCPLYYYRIRGSPALHWLYRAHIGSLQSRSASYTEKEATGSHGIPCAHTGSTGLTWDPLGPPESHGIHRAGRGSLKSHSVPYIPMESLQLHVVPILAGILCESYRSRVLQQPLHSHVIHRAHAGSLESHRIHQAHIDSLESCSVTCAQMGSVGAAQDPVDPLVTPVLILDL